MSPSRLKSSSASIVFESKVYRKTRSRSVLSSATIAAAAMASATSSAKDSNRSTPYSQATAFSPTTAILSTPHLTESLLKKRKTSRFFAKNAASLPKKTKLESEFDVAQARSCADNPFLNEKKEQGAQVKEEDDKTGVPRTESFEPMWHGTLHPETSVKVHTLILGTHPSVQSLEKSQYYAHPMNAFWWIAGDCLGFRRASGVSSSSGKPYKFADNLVHGEDKIIPYEQQLEVMASHGFAMWDILGSCERKGSLDNDIKKEVPNSIREFCQEHPTINRIIMANGTKQCAFFNKYFADWWLSGELKPGTNESSQMNFKKWSKRTNGFENCKIEVYCMPGVSPAAASISYEIKRDTFRELCYNPGLSDHKKINLG